MIDDGGQRSPIPTNLITGFLGVGKTTAIRALLADHPADQHWAVLVNEFGEVGVDRALIDQPEITVQEVAGGCLCCVSAPAFTTALNRLIRQHRPDRILIEPSGLGHPARVLETLTGPLYAGVLDVRATVCLLDARHLRSTRHLAHETFADQIHLADVLVANKADCYSDADRAAFEDFITRVQPVKRRIGITEQARFDPDWLDLRRSDARQAAFPEAHAFLAEIGTGTPPETGDWLMTGGFDSDYHRAGWLIEAQRPWPIKPLREWLDTLPMERKKGLFLTDSGWLTLNQDDWASVSPPDDGRNRLELIDVAPIAASEIDAVLRRLDGSIAKPV